MFTYRLTETHGGWKITEIESNIEVYESSTPLSISEIHLPSMYEEIFEATGIDHFDIEDGRTGLGLDSVFNGRVIQR